MKLPRHVHGYLDRHGRPRHYLRRPGHKSVALPGLPWSTQFMDAYAAALADVPAAIGEDRARPGTMAALVVTYYGTSDFAELAENTKTLYRGICEKLRAEHGDRRVAMLQFEHVQKLMAAKEARKATANAWLRMLRTLMKLAVRLKLRTDDPTQGVRRYKIKNDGIHSWTEEEVAAFEAVHPIGTRARLALALALYTGQRLGDVIRMGRQHVRNGHITIKQQKTGVEVCIPVHPRLADIIAAAPSDNLTFLTTGQGKPFTAGGFGNWFRDVCNEAELRQCSVHGLRKAACRRLAEAGCTTHQIAAISGHESLREIERYTKAARRKMMAAQAMAVIESGTKTG